MQIQDKVESEQFDVQQAGQHSLFVIFEWWTEVVFMSRSVLKNTNQTSMERSDYNNSKSKLAHQMESFLSGVQR